MNRNLEHKLAFAVAAFLAFMIAILIVCMITEASTTGILSTDSQGNVYATHTGWLKVDGRTYYIHKTKSHIYDKGEACRNEYRWRNGKLYYFADDGRMITSSTHYIKLNSDDSVKYVYIPGTNHCERFNVNLRRYQKLTKRCRWIEVGNQTNMWWACDWQE